MLIQSRSFNNSRITIGFLIDFFWEKYQANIWNGIVDEAEKNNLNLICYLGGPLNSPEAHHAPRHTVYQLIDEVDVDGLIIMTGTIGNFAKKSDLETFCNQYRPLPMVSVGSYIKTIPSILTDSELGMRNVVEHLIVKHRCHQLAFIRGTEGNTEAELRFNIYCEILSKYNIPYQPELVVTGDFYIGSGAKAVAELIDRRQVKFDAVIASNDIMAIDAINELQNRKIRVPYDVAVIGFDDIAEAGYIKPPLTTVRQPLFDTGRNAVKTLLALIKNQTVFDKQLLPSEVIVRRSCGCFSEKTELFFIINDQFKNIELSSGENIYDESFLTKLTYDVVDEISSIIQNKKWFEWIQRLIQTIIADLSRQNLNGDNFIACLDNLIQYSNQIGIEVFVWRKIVSAIIGRIIRKLNTENELKYINQTYNNALEVIFENEHEYQVSCRLKSEKMTRELHRISIDLITTFQQDELKNILAKELPGLGINRCYISQYVDKDSIYQRAQLLVAYDDKCILDIDNTTLTFPPKHLIPDNLKTADRRDALIVMSLYFKHEQLGFVVFDVTNNEGKLYETLAIQLSGALKGIKLIEEAQNYAIRLENEVNLRTSDLQIANMNLKNEIVIRKKTARVLKKKNKEIKRLNKELKLKSRIDSLTNLYNRDALFQFLNIERSRILRYRWRRENNFNRNNNRIFKLERKYLNKPLDEWYDHFGNFSVMMIDLDHFKMINDKYGHFTGDKVLKLLGELFINGEILREDDIVGRFGGEEFIIILPNTNAENALILAQRLIKKLDEVVFEGNETQPQFKVTLSIGISQFFNTDTDKEQVIHRADKAMYYAKEHGRNQAVIYENIKEKTSQTI